MLSFALSLTVLVASSHAKPEAEVTAATTGERKVLAAINLRLGECSATLVKDGYALICPEHDERFFLYEDACRNYESVSATVFDKQSGIIHSSAEYEVPPSAKTDYKDRLSFIWPKPNSYVATNEVDIQFHTSLLAGQSVCAAVQSLDIFQCVRAPKSLIPLVMPSGKHQVSIYKILGEDEEVRNDETLTIQLTMPSGEMLEMRASASASTTFTVYEEGTRNDLQGSPLLFVPTSFAGGGHPTSIRPEDVVHVMVMSARSLDRSFV